MAQEIDKDFKFDAKLSEHFKAAPKIYKKIFSYLDQRLLQQCQHLSKQFYEYIIPKTIGKQRGVRNNCINDYFFTNQKPLLNAGSINHIVIIDSENILVSFDSHHTKIYTFMPTKDDPFK